MNPVSERAELREALAEPPSVLGFRLVCAILDTWTGDDRQATLDFARQQLDAWPDEMRLAGWTWCCAAAHGERTPSGPLARTVDTAGPHLGCRPVALNAFAQEENCRHIAQLRLVAYFGEHGSELNVLTEGWENWTALRVMTVPAYFKHDECLSALLSSPLIERLRSLHFAGGGRRTWDPAALARPLPELQSLSIRAGMDDRLIDTLEALDAPNLQTLSLDGGFHDGFKLSAVRRLARLPLLGQIRALSVGTEWTDKALLALVQGGRLNLHALTVRGNYIHDYLHTVNEHRIGAAGCRALARSGALQHVQTLSIHFQRVGDELVDLVRATTPGELRTLELLDVELTDEGPEVLATLPQLAGLRELNLQANPLTPRGVRALARSPHLKNLRSLTLGGNDYNPYYGYCHPRPVQDEGIAALLESAVVEGLEFLALPNAKIGPAGAGALVTSPKLLRLKHLDLSLNPFGLESAEVLHTADLPALETLVLSCCRLEDRSIAALTRGKLPALRVLDLSYNSVGPTGAKALAAWPVLTRLRSLNLHDNLLGTEGLIALAGAAQGQLIEFDVEQDCWNSRAGYFDDEAARAVAESAFFARLDAFWGGMVDEYHGCRYWHPFRDSGMRLLQESKWRPQARWGLLLSEHDPQVGEQARDARQMKEEDARRMHDQDFRSHPPRERTDPPMEGYQVGYGDVSDEGRTEDE